MISFRIVSKIENKIWNDLLTYYFALKERIINHCTWKFWLLFDLCWIGPSSYFLRLLLLFSHSYLSSFSPSFFVKPDPFGFSQELFNLNPFTFWEKSKGFGLKAKGRRGIEDEKDTEDDVEAREQSSKKLI